jgi:glycosyltransferase involved in cell wall biosynthesis
MTPTPSEASRDTTNAIHNIVCRLQKHLPDYGFELVEQPDHADLRAGHAGQGSGQPIDIATYHGLYPTGMGMDGIYFSINSHVIRNLKTAKAITAPSNWIADVIRRDMHISPHIIPWGVDTREWTPGEQPHVYALWNKARVDFVSDPTPMLQLAERAHTVPFLTTFGQGTPNVKTIGRQPYETMKGYVRNAGVYLSTNVETFGIGVLEACASGVPILGFRQGAIADYIEHGVHGFLAEPGDIDGLYEGLQYCYQYRKTLGANARELAKQYTWAKVAERMAAVYRRVLEPHQGAKCSVIIPCHDYGWCVNEAIESALAQQTRDPFEVIVVLDRCTDNSAEVVGRYADRVKVLTVDNGNLSATRNSGIQHATGEYVACLDADDHIGSPLFLQTLADALDADRTLGIAFTSIRVMDAEGKLGHLNNWPKGYNFDLQAQRKNQIPSLCLFRKEAWRRAGGFRPYFRYAEDAEFWTTVGAIGYGAKHVVEDGWFEYRLHNKSASQVHRTGEVPEPDWTEYHPWTKDGQRPFAADGKAPHGSWPVRFYNKPDVSVIIPVGPGHEETVKDALHSVEGQTHRFWDCIVVNDTGAPLCLEGFPWAKVVATKGKTGAGAARNLGAKHSHAPFLVFLDADDLLKPRYLEATLKAYRLNGRYAYVDWMTDDRRGHVEVHPTPAYSMQAVWERPSIHPITALIPRKAFDVANGFDEQMTAFEDVDFFMKLLTKGYCGVRVAEPLLVYNVDKGKRRAQGEQHKDAFKTLLKARYGEFMEGKRMCDCIDPPKGKAPVPPTLENVADYREAYGEMIKIQLTHQFAGESPVTFRGPATRVNYGRRAKNDIFFIWEKDLTESDGVFTKIETYVVEQAATVIPPAPVNVNEYDTEPQVTITPAAPSAIESQDAELNAKNEEYAAQFDYPIDNGLATYAPEDKEPTVVKRTPARKPAKKRKSA